MGNHDPLTENERFPFIDGLRGVAILLVVFHHGYYFFLLPTIGNSWNGNWLGSLFFVIAKSGFWGVHLFFIVSGFLITGLLMDFINGKLDVGRFYLRRCFKILPHYYFFTGLVFIPLFVFNLIQISSGLSQLFPYLVFFQNYIPGVPWLDHTWSIVVEEQFYIFWSLYLFLLSKFLVAPKDRWTAAIVGAVLLAVFITINRFTLYTRGISLIYSYPMSTHLTHATAVIADGLMIGCILRLLWFRYPEFFRGKKAAYLFYFSGVLALMVLFNLPLNDWGVPGFWYSADLAWFFSICFIIAGLGGVAWVMDHSWLRWIGRNSYGIYLVHYPLLLFFQSKIQGKGYLPLIIYILLAVGTGFFTTETIEKYFLHIRKKIAP